MSDRGRDQEGDDCLFCRILNGSIPSRAVEISDPSLAEETYAFEDVSPQAPQHILVIPRRHIRSVNELEAGDAELVGKLVLAARSIAKERNMSEAGYRLVLNTNAGAGQTVFHIHLHVLGGRPMSWPPG